MIDQKRRKFYDDTVREWIHFLPADLDDIGAGLHAIVQTGRRGFEFENAELIEFVRRSLRALVDKGAKPRHWGSRSQPDRNIMLHYGNDTHDEIVEGAIADWLASGAGDLEWGDFWFALQTASTISSSPA
jgi:hypothetical protein